MEAEHQRLGHASISGLNHIRVCTDHVKDMFKEIILQGYAHLAIFIILKWKHSFAMYWHR